MGRIGILLMLLSLANACSHTRCMIVDADCCGCRRGGKQKAIRMDDYPAWKQQHDMTCKGKVCIQMMSQDPSCNYSNAEYVNGMCELNGTNPNP